MMENQEAPLNSLFMQSPFAMTIIRASDFTVELANDKALEIWNKNKEDVYQKNIFDIFPEPANQRLKLILQNVYITGKPYISTENPIRLFKNGIGTDSYLNFFYEPIRDSKGDIKKIMGIGIEITDQVVARQQIELMETRSRLAIEAGKMGTFDWDFSEKTFISAPRLLEIFGFKGMTEVSHEELIDAYHPEDKPIRDAAVKQSFVSGALEFEGRIIWKDQSIHWVRVYGKVHYNQKREPLKMYGLVIDITEEREVQQNLLRTSESLIIANEELTASNEELAASNALLNRTNADLDNFIYTASHDLKAPVSNLEGLFNNLLNEIELNPEIEKLKEMIHASFKRFKKTVFELTEITKLQHETDQDHSLISFHELLNDAMIGIQDQIKQSRAEILIDFKVPRIKFSEKNLRSILYNLVSNAIKYKSYDKDPIVKISTYKNKEFIVLQVSDNGLGLTAGDLNKIFGMFKRVHDHVEGTGIGLYIVKKMVENAGGKIEVKSELGKGSSFMVYFKNIP